MGFPLLGETVEMFRDPPLFHGSRRERHGDIYKTKILGGPVVTVHDAKECRRLLLADGTLTETNWPTITRKLMGENSILLQTGKKHAAQRRLLGQAFTRDAVDGYAPLVDAAVRGNLERWAREGCVKGMGSGKDLAFEVAARALVASGAENEEDDMSQETM
jgi:cytochrome P450